MYKEEKDIFTSLKRKGKQGAFGSLSFFVKPRRRIELIKLVIKIAK